MKQFPARPSTRADKADWRPLFQGYAVSAEVRRNFVDSSVFGSRANTVSPNRYFRKCAQGLECLRPTEHRCCMRLPANGMSLRGPAGLLIFNSAGSIQSICHSIFRLSSRPWTRTTRIERQTSIGGIPGLLEHEQELKDAALAGTVGPEQSGHLAEPDIQLSPSLEVVDFKSFQHQSILAVESHRTIGRA